MAVITIEDCATSRAPGRMIRRLDKIMSAYVESKFDGMDLSFAQWVALKVVRDGVVGNAGELARELGITTGATTRMIDVLETRGLMARDRDAEDRRVVRLVITQAGSEAITALQGHVVGAWNEVLADYSQDEVKALVAMLIKLLAAAERVSGGMPMPKENDE